MKKFFLLVMFSFFAVTQYVTAQEELFVNEGETVVYRVALDVSVQSGTVSDALQNLPGVRVDMEGNITMRGVSNVEIFINDQPSHFSEDAQKNYIQQTSVMNIKEIRVMANPSARYTTATGTGIINIILKEEKKANQALNIGVQASIPTCIGMISTKVSSRFIRRFLSRTALKNNTISVLVTLTRPIIHT